MRPAARPVLARPPRGARLSTAGLLAVLPLALLAGCGGSDEPAATSSTSTSASLTPLTSHTVAPSSPDQAPSSTTTAAAGQTLQITVAGKQVTPAPATVDLKVGETLTLTVTSDVANELHVHGFDVEKELPAGQPVTVELVGKEQGTFEVETHHPELLLAKISVR